MTRHYAGLFLGPVKRPIPQIPLLNTIFLQSTAVLLIYSRKYSNFISNEAFIASKHQKIWYFTSFCTKTAQDHR